MIGIDPDGSEGEPESRSAAWRATPPLWELGEAPSVGPPVLAPAQEEMESVKKKNQRLTDALSERIWRRRRQSGQA